MKFYVRLFLLLVSTPALTFAQQANAPTAKPQPSSASSAKTAKPAVKRVHVDMAGFELDKNPVQNTTQVGGGSRGGDGKITLLAPHMAQVYTANPVFEWAPSTRAHDFVFSLFDSSGKQIYQITIGARSLRYPADAPALQPGATYLWAVQPQLSLLGDPSPKYKIVMLPAADRKEISDSLQQIGSQTPEQWKQQAELFTQRRLWFDATEVYSQLIEQRPADSDLYEKRGTIYDQIPNTEKLAEHDFAKADELRAGKSR